MITPTRGRWQRTGMWEMRARGRQPATLDDRPSRPFR
jgi:hypothetical protein